MTGWGEIALNLTPMVWLPNAPKVTARQIIANSAPTTQHGGLFTPFLMEIFADPAALLINVRCTPPIIVIGAAGRKIRSAIFV
jgi:hypothetical protein